MEAPRLVALTPGDLQGADHGRTLAALGEAIDAGLCGVLVREPRLSDRDLLALTRALRALLGEHERTWIALHDRPHLARLAGADACHLGFRSLEPATVRRSFGPELILGLSTHADDDPARWQSADYLFHGPIRETRSHPDRDGGDWNEPIATEGLARAIRSTDRPILALGGIRPKDVGSVLRAGARGIAVLSGIVRAPAPGRAAEEYLTALEGNA